MDGIFDTHLHLGDDVRFDDLYAQSTESGVSHFLLAGTNRTDIGDYARLASAHANVFYTAGIHPLDCQDFQDSDADLVRRHLADGAVAVGEIGLDNHYDVSTPEIQKKVFELMLRLAAETGKPVQIHCREAFDTCYAMVRDILPTGHPIIIHSFTDTQAEAEKWLELGAYLGYNGMVTFKKADNIRETLAAVPLERLLLETDSPYLAPVPYRGKVNSPAFLPKIVEKIAEIRDIDSQYLIDLTRANGLRAFGIHP